MFSNFCVSVVPCAVYCVVLNVCFIGARNEKVDVSTGIGQGVSLPGDKGRLVVTPPML